MSRLLLRAGARWHLRHRWQLGLAVLGITLGVAVVTAVDVATGSARRAFELSTEAVAGRATHEVIGGPAGLPDSLYARIVVEAGADSAAPVIDRYVRLPDHGGRTLRLLGIDPFAEAPFRGWVAPAAGQLDFGALLAQRMLLLEAGTAADIGVAAGDTVRVSVGTRTTTAIVGGVLRPADPLAARALGDVVLADIATAQEIAGINGIDRIELRTGGAQGDALLERIARVLTPGARLLETEVRTGATANLTRAFETNLTALALVALVFGMFLIYNSVTFSVVQRRPLLGLLRTQGVTARELFLLVLAEAAVLGAVATLLGLAVGTVLGAQLVRMVARTINDLYFAVSVTSVTVSPVTVAKAALLGLGATVLAAVPPAAEAVRARPRAALARATLERGARRAGLRLARFGALAAVVAAALLAVPSRSIIVGFGALFVLIFAAALLTPGATLGLMALVRPLAARLGAVPRLATRGVSASLSRTAPAIAALSVALAVGIAVTVMITSFRASVVAWLERTLQADVYVSAPDFGGNRTDVVLDDVTIAAIVRMPEVAGVSTYRHTNLLLDDGLTRMIAVRLHGPHFRAFQLLDSVADVWQRFAAGDILISEPLAFRRGLGAGDSIALPTDRGAMQFAIAAVYRDYASEHGVIFIDRTAYERVWTDRATTSLGLFLGDGADADAVARTLRALPAGGGLVARPNRGLRDASLAVFDRTFVITGVLRILSLLVAFVGVTGALMALQLERAKEIGVLRTIGLTPGQVWGLVTLQTALMGLAAALLALPLGAAMAWAMVHVINRRSFGWTSDMLITPAPLLQALGVGIGAAVLAGLYPAWRMSRLSAATAMREE
ncbi:MAG TPA: FtsX-like permease family protein [Longimicrobiales bacterium]|nr:FtsX-like permease family protein [Longimicrobiales bacterium]